jgi:hypothetical protein
MLAAGRLPLASPAQPASLSASARRALGFPVGSEHFRGKSSAEEAFAWQRPEGRLRLTQATDAPPDWYALGRRFAHLRDLRRRFVFEYYPWYSTDPWEHWGENLRHPPVDIAASRVPWLGAYDSADLGVLEQHARWIVESGAGAINLSWWGRNDVIDTRVHRVMDVMRAHDIHVTFHLEPYADDRVNRYVSDVMYLLREYGEKRRWDAFLLLEHPDGSSGPVFKSFRTILPPTSTDCLGVTRPVPDYVTDDLWRRRTDAVRRELRVDFERVVLLADTTDAARTARSGFDGIAIYDAFVRPSAWEPLARACTERNLVFSFNINVGFDKYPARGPQDVCFRPAPFEPPMADVDWESAAGRRRAERASLGRVVESAQQTLTLQGSPDLANASRGLLLTYVNSFNEWHEGSAFEPAKDHADLTSAERAIGYHNPEDGRARLERLRDILRDVYAGAEEREPALDQSSVFSFQFSVLSFQFSVLSCEL